MTALKLSINNYAVTWFIWLICLPRVFGCTIELNREFIYLFISLSLKYLIIVPSIVSAILVSYRISSVPSSIGNCSSLIEVFPLNFMEIFVNRVSVRKYLLWLVCLSMMQIDLSSNLLVELPETVGNLTNLKVLFLSCHHHWLILKTEVKIMLYIMQALHLSNNGLKCLPPLMFKMCTQLSTLDLHGTEVTNDVLRQVCLTTIIFLIMLLLEPVSLSSISLCSCIGCLSSWISLKSL